MSLDLGPLHRFVSSRKSFLDTLFTDIDRRRPAFATITRNQVTNLYRIDERGRMADVGEVRWDARGAADHTVTLRGRTLRSAEFLVCSKKLFGGNAWQFSADARAYKWKPASHGAARNWQDWQLMCWACHAQPAPAGAPPVATFTPPQPGILKAELAVRAGARAILDVLLLSCIVLCAQAAEWRTAASAHSVEALERALRAEALGALPPYLPVAVSGHRSPPGRRAARRPHTAGGVPSAPRPLASEPPPYTSRVNVNTPY